QRRFSYLPGGESSAPWQVPVQVQIDTLSGQEVRRVLLSEAETSLRLPGDTQAVVVNQGGHGFYRVQYEPGLLQALLDRLAAVTAIERFNLINDAWAAAQAGLMGLSDYLDLTARFLHEPDRNVWSVLLGSFAYLARIVEDDDRPGLQKLVRARLGPMVAELGWQRRPGEDELTSQLRGDLLRAVGTLGDD